MGGLSSGGRTPRSCRGVRVLPEQLLAQELWIKRSRGHACGLRKPGLAHLDDINDWSRVIVSFVDKNLSYSVSDNRPHRHPLGVGRDHNGGRAGRFHLEPHFLGVGYRTQGRGSWRRCLLPGPKRIYGCNRSPFLGTLDLHGVSLSHQIAGSSERPLSPAALQNHHCRVPGERKVGPGTFLEPDRQGIEEGQLCPRD